MSTERAENEQSREQGESRERQPVEGSSGLLKSGVNAREAARLSVEARRGKARQRQEEAEHAARTVHERAAVALAKLTQCQLDDAVQAIAREAAAGKVQAFKAMLDYLRLAHVEERQEDERMTPEDRAQILAEVDRWRQPGRVLPPPAPGS